MLAAQAEFGARPLRRALRREVDDPLSRMLLNGEIPEGAHVRIDAGDDVALAIDVHSAPVTGTATVAGTTTGADNTGGTDV
nr:hypothetical protein [Actinomadura kijaniata]